MFREVPVLPVVVPLGAAIAVSLSSSLHRRGLFSLPRATVALALGVYAGGIVANTVFPIYLNKPTGSMGWSSALNLIPIADYELGDAVMNIVVFAPLGVLFALAPTRSTPGRIIAAVAAVSLTIEVTQYVTAHLLAGGHIADVNDLLFNVIGGALGLGILTCLARLAGLNGVIVKLRWRDGGAASAESRSNEFGGAT